MAILTVTNLKHAFGTRTVLRGATLSVDAGEKIGLVGRNGSGKTTLLKAIQGALEPDEGSLQIQRGVRVGYLGQHSDLDPNATVRGAAESAFAKLHALHDELDMVFEQMANADGGELDRLLKRQSVLETEIASEGGYAVGHLIDATLEGLGFTPDQFDQKTETLSGGERGRLRLAHLLLQRPDLLLLDEPTNHLDIDGCRWLEKFLADEFSGAVIVVSHDRWLLDRVVNRIAEVERGVLRVYPGNYAAYIELRHERMLTDARRHAKQLDKIRAEESFIRKYKEGQRAKQARGRASRLERYKKDELVERPQELDVMNLTLPKPPRVGDVLIAAEHLTHGFGERTLFENFSISIRPGDRIGIIGPNGIGKTTFVRALIGDLVANAGHTRSSPRLSVGWFRQTQDHLDLSLTVWQYLQSVIVSLDGEVRASEQQARNLAGAFLYSGEEQDKILELLSGGERARAMLAGLVAGAHNLLILDEPSNHLDIPSAERLEEALLNYGKTRGQEGAVILISHDRALLEATCTQLLEFHPVKGLRLFHGRYSEFRAEKDATERASREAIRPAKPARKPKTAASKTTDNNPLARLSTSKIESRIEEIESGIAKLDKQFLDSDVWDNHAKMRKIQDERQRLQQELEPLEFEWSHRAGDEP